MSDWIDVTTLGSDCEEQVDVEMPSGAPDSVRFRHRPRRFIDTVDDARDPEIGYGPWIPGRAATWEERRARRAWERSG